LQSLRGHIAIAAQSPLNRSSIAALSIFEIALLSMQNRFAIKSQSNRITWQSLNKHNTIASRSHRHRSAVTHSAIAALSILNSAIDAKSLCNQIAIKSHHKHIASQKHRNRDHIAIAAQSLTAQSQRNHIAITSLSQSNHIEIIRNKFAS
jgi:hypothetical protein